MSGKRKPMAPKLIVGLGNPGPAYARTYHNAGVLFVMYVKERPLPTPPGTLVASPISMNLSGPFVKKALKEHSAKPGELVVAHDDSDIPLGSFKLSFGRGSAGHRGIESVIATLRTKNFFRLRIGIRKSAAHGAREKASAFVLNKIPARDMAVLEAVFSEALQALAPSSSQALSAKTIS
jgi:PTH1 family peptidyl-tRNA hydrolase